MRDDSTGNRGNLIDLTQNNSPSLFVFSRFFFFSF